MKRVFLFVISVFINYSIIAQVTSTSDLIRDCQKVEFHAFGVEVKNIKFFYNGLDKEEKICSIDEFSSLIEPNIFNYFQLAKTYNTDLKRKVFTNSPEYADLANKVSKERTIALQNTYYFQYELKNQIDGDGYNMDQKAFVIKHSVADVDHTPLQGYVNFHDGLCLTYPAKFTKTEYHDYGSRGAYYKQFIKAPIAHENIALKIEENINDCALLFIFKIDKTIKRKAWAFMKDFVLGNTQAVYIVNKKTNEIYDCIFSTKRVEGSYFALKDAGFTIKETDMAESIRAKEQEEIADARETERQEAEERRVAQEKTAKIGAINSRAKNAYGGGKTDNGLQSSGQGHTYGSGNQGSPDGTPGANQYGLGGGAGKGISYSLTARNARSLPKPAFPGNEAGIVVVEVTVDKFGKVTKALPGIKGSNTFNADLLEAAKKAALTASFNTDQNAPAFQKGTITYHFIIQ